MSANKISTRVVGIVTVLLLTLGLASGAFRGICVDDDGPADFNNIQAAINDANDGDRITVADGTYTGNGNRDIDFLGKAITVHSENGTENSAKKDDISRTFACKGPPGATAPFGP